jgi:putative ABC transport system permease protein
MARRGHLRLGQRVRLASNGPASVMTVVGVVGTRAKVDRQGVMFVTAPEAERLADLAVRVDAIGVLPAPGVDEAALERRVRDALHGQARS